MPLSAISRERMTEAAEGFEAYPRYIRVLGPHERGRFTAEAWGYLVGLSRSGILEAVELEQVIDRVLSHFEGRVALADLRTVVGDGASDGSEPGPTPTTH